MIVVDLTVVMPQLMPEARSAAVLRIAVRDRIWLMPPLWRIAVCDELLYHVRAGRIAPDMARTLQIAAGMLVRDSHERITEAHVLELGVSSGLAGVQSLYVLTARSIGASLVTFDPEILSACPDTAVSAEVFGQL